MSESSSLESQFARWGALVPALVAVSFALSVAYDYAFAWGLGLTLEQLPLTLTDHTRTALFWAPWLFLGALIGLALSVLSDAGRHQEIGAAGGSGGTAEDGAQVRRMTRHGWIVAGVSALPLLLFGEHVASLVALATYFVSLALVYRLFSFARLGVARAVRWRVALGLGLGFAMACIGMGWQRARVALLNPASQEVSVEYKGGDESRTAFVVRTYEDFVLAVDARGVVQIIQRDEIRRFSSRRRVWPFRGLWGAKERQAVPRAQEDESDDPTAAPEGNGSKR